MVAGLEQLRQPRRIQLEIDPLDGGAAAENPGRSRATSSQRSASGRWAPHVIAPFVTEP